MSRPFSNRDWSRAGSPISEPRTRTRRYEDESSVRLSVAIAPAEDRYTRELERANEELRRANQQLEEFAFVASHDLREPLRMVNIYTQLLIQRCAPNCDPQADQFAEHIRSSVARMEKLIQDVLQYSHAIHPDNEYPAVRVPLRNAVDQALAVVRDRIEETGAQVEIGELPVVLGDEMQLALVFQNLLANSLKYAHPERKLAVRITAERCERVWSISVADNGIGFEPQFAERIFGLFKRLHGRDVPGTGLGLAICKRIIERHGGTIRAESRPQQGATFIFTLKGWNYRESSECSLANPAGRGQPR
jgi:light-regulated signal transduction histidine kinase (bacteriophytochrome)